MKIKRIEANWYADKDGEHFLTYDITQNCTFIEEREGYMYVTMDGEIHRLPLSIVNITIYDQESNE